MFVATVEVKPEAFVPCVVKVRGAGSPTTTTLVGDPLASVVATVEVKPIVCVP